jgi:hypothetical protein
MGTTRSRLKSGNVKARVRREQLAWSKPLPRYQPPNPHGIPTDVMRTLAQENLSSDPAALNRRLQELLAGRNLKDGD